MARKFISLVSPSYRTYRARFTVKENAALGWFVFDNLFGRPCFLQEADKARCIEYAQVSSGFEPADGKEETYERQVLAAIEQQRQRDEEQKRRDDERRAALVKAWREERKVKAAAHRTAIEAISTGPRPSEGMSREDLIDTLITMAEDDPRALRRMSLDDLRTRYDRRRAAEDSVSTLMVKRDAH